MSEKIRSFISVDITDQVLLNKIIRLQQTLLETGADLKLVEPENLHLTLRFLGEITKPTLELVREELKSLKFNQFKLNLRGIGVFPSLHRVNVIWIGIREGEEKLKEIAKKVELILKKLSFPPDQKRFSPHLTIARVRTGKNKDKLVSFIEKFNNYEVGLMVVDSVRLKKSILTPKGPIYTTIDTVQAEKS